MSSSLDAMLPTLAPPSDLDLYTGALDLQLANQEQVSFGQGGLLTHEYSSINPTDIIPSYEFPSNGSCKFALLHSTPDVNQLQFPFNQNFNQG